MQKSMAPQRSSCRVDKKSTGKRKFHKKSRKGCLTCKKRRVKCDEKHPVCGGCDRMALECVYATEEDEIPAPENESKPLSNLTNLNLGALSPLGPLPDELKDGESILSALADSSLPIPPMAQSFLNGFPMDKQVQLIQQFTSLPQEKQQELYQSLPLFTGASPVSTTTIKSEHQNGVSIATPTPIPTKVKDTIMANENSGAITGTTGATDPLSGLIGELLSNRPQIKIEGKTPTPQELQQHYQEKRQSGPALSPDSIKSPLPSINKNTTIPGNNKSESLNLLDLRLMYHYTTKVWPTITAAGISDSKIWSDDIPMLAFQYSFLMHSVLAFSATHLSRSERGLDECVTYHRAEALRLLREAILEMSPENTDALVASALILIMDSLANASLPSSTSVKSLPPSAWIFHVKGAATILTAVWPLSEKSRFYKFISVDLGDLGEIGYDLISGELISEGNSTSTTNNRTNNNNKKSIHINPDLTQLATILSETYSKFDEVRYSNITCFDNEIDDLFPIALNSPYFPTVAYMYKLYQERLKSDFILRIFAFPALLDKKFLGLLISCDLTAMRIMKCYYKLLRNFTEEMKEKVWFLEGVSTVLPVDVDQYAGGGGMHMMLDFLGGPSTVDDDGNGENWIEKRAAESGLLDTNNLPSVGMSEDDVENTFMDV